MLQPEQLVMGVTAGLMLSALLRRAPSWRELLVAVIAAVAIDLAISVQTHREFDLTGVVLRLFNEIPVYPHTCPCAALVFATLVFIGILAMLYVLRG
jgi:hypothetical protein